jgi:DNA-directed RNA polymerase subunit RPC12/RpoP
MTLDGHLTGPVEIDVCSGCQAFWFDKYEDLKLSAASTLQLMKFIGQNTSSPRPVSDNSRCPRCSARLLFTHDMQRSTKFTYWQCPNNHGRFIGFFDFLREKNFVRPLSPHEINDLRQKVQTVNCSNCGGAIDLAKDSACPHCGSPISILDMNQPQQMLNELKKAAEPLPIDPALPFELLMETHRVQHLFGPTGSDPDWLTDASSSGLIQAGLTAFARWLTKSGL